MVDAKGRYLHWDELRRRTPPPGLTHEEWWLATKLARTGAAQQIALKTPENRAFWFCEPPTLRAQLRMADMNAAGVLASDRAGLTPADGHRFLRRSLAEEPFSSSFIEGAATTRDIAKQLIYENRRPRTRDERMVLNNYRGIEFVKERLQERLTVEFVKELHRIITESTLDDPGAAGALRRNDLVQVVDDSTGEILHQPPPHESLPERLAALCEFANAESEAPFYIHPLLRAIILHFALAYEHPFIDGNGRTARALFYWSALRAGYWLMEYVSISRVIAQSKVAYGSAFLKTETDDLDLTYFLLHQAETIQAALEQLHAYAERRMRELGEFERRLNDQNREDGFNSRQSALLNDAARGRLQRVTIAEHQARYKVSYLTARADLEDLAERGLLRKRKQGRQSIYTPQKDLVARMTTANPKQT